MSRFLEGLEQALFRLGPVGILRELVKARYGRPRSMASI
jgi:hypothetical protein